MKKCCTCKILKELNEFCKDNKQRDKLNLTCRSCIKISRDKYKHKHIAQKKTYREKNKGHKAEYDLIYREQNKEKIKQHKINWELKNKNNIIHRIKRNLRRRIHHVIKDNCKSDHTMNLLGCSVEEFKSYLESKFHSGMTWNNYGLGKDKWHIDHIRPCCDFDLSKPEEQKICFHYTNMQPLWETDNLKKSYIFEGKNCRIKI